MAVDICAKLTVVIEYDTGRGLNTWRLEGQNEGDKHNVFISWSGQRSKWAAEALREWLRLVLQAARPWMSGEDIDKGSRGLDEVSRALEGMKIGIICLTPENLDERWILYEAGALSKGRFVIWSPTQETGLRAGRC
jgi:hypothetical protein